MRPRKLRKRDKFHEFSKKIDRLTAFLENRKAEEHSSRSGCKLLLDQLVGKMASLNARQAEQLRPILDQLLARFDAPTEELGRDNHH